MKYIKMFEKVKTRLAQFKVGDYVIGDNCGFEVEELKEFFLNNVGKIIIAKNYYYIKYDFPCKYMIDHYYNSLIIIDIVDRYNDSVRLATEEEIKNQNIKDSMKKYNL